MDDDFASLVARVTRLEQKSINLNTDIFGLFETVSTAPSEAPTNVYQQVKIYVNGATYRLYLYDAVGHAWHYVALT